MRKLPILRRQGGILKHFDLRAGMIRFIVYAYNIEPPLARRWQLAPILSRDLRYLPTLMPVDRRLGRLHIMRRAGLNFYKAKDIVIPSDQVDLATAAG